MKSLRARSLRTQLLLMGLVTALVPILVLFGVVVASSSSEEIIGSETLPTGDVVEVVGRSESAAVPQAVVAAAIILIVAVIAAVWWWSGQAVRPLRTMAAVADEIQAGSLDQRIGLTGQASEVQMLGDNFDTMLERISQASDVQQRLIEDTSHELRTPLAALAINNEVILSNESPTLADYRASSERNKALIERLQTTIDDLLVGARVRNQNARQIDNDLMKIIARVKAEHVALNPATPLRVDGPQSLLLGIDGPSVQRALVNLVENASRFSPAGREVVITVSSAPDPSVSVTDYGPGIDPAEQHLVFDRYYRSDDDAHSDSERQGIGLALVKQVADAHGHISVESPLADGQGGTRFTITFAQQV